MIPGVSTNKHFKNMEVDEREILRVEAIINSMTPEERESTALSMVAGASASLWEAGPGFQDVNKLLKNYTQVMKMMQKFNKGGIRSLRGMLPF